MPNLIRKLEHSEQLITSSVENWKLHNDVNGYKAFMNLLAYMEHIVDQHYHQLAELKKPLYSHLEVLAQYVQRKDIIAIIDKLEYELLPLLSQWKKDVNLNDRNETEQTQ